MLRFLSVSLAASLVVITGYLLPRADQRQQIESVVSIAVAAPADSTYSTNGNSLVAGQQAAPGATDASAATATDSAAKPMTELERRFAELNGLIEANKGNGAVFGARSPILMPVALRGTATTTVRSSHTEADQRDKLAAAERELTRLAANPDATEALADSDPNAQFELARKLQQELRRVGCYRGRIDGDWGSGSRSAMTRFNDAMQADLPIETPHRVLLSVVSQQDNRVCGSRCEAGSQPDSYGRCIANRSEQIAETADDNPWKARTVRVAVTRTLPANDIGTSSGYASLGVPAESIYSVNGISQVRRQPKLTGPAATGHNVRVLRPTALPSRERAERAVKSKPRYSLGSAPRIARAKTNTYRRTKSSSGNNWKRAVFTPR